MTINFNDLNSQELQLKNMQDNFNQTSERLSADFIPESILIP